MLKIGDKVKIKNDSRLWDIYGIDPSLPHPAGHIKHWDYLIQNEHETRGIRKEDVEEHYITGENSS